MLKALDWHCPFKHAYKKLWLRVVAQPQEEGEGQSKKKLSGKKRLIATHFAPAGLGLNSHCQENRGCN